MKFDRRWDYVYNEDSYASMIYYAEYQVTDNLCRYIAYQNTTRVGAERQDYIKEL